jgi:Flp pilus assembly protein TadG
MLGYGINERENSRGSAAIELTLMMPLLLTVTFGLIEFGRAFELRQHLVTVASEAANVGTQLSCPRPTSAEVLDAANSVLTAAGLAPSLASITLSNPGGIAGSEMVVDVSYQAEFPLLSKFMNLTALHAGSLQVAVHVAAENE